MSSRNLEYLLAPRSVALVGASDRPGSVGATVMRNLIAGGFDGAVWPVNLRHASVAGRAAFARARDLPSAPDLAVICTPAPTVPELISELGAMGTRAAVVITAGLDAPARSGGTLAQAMLDAARPYTLRVLGPGCLGLLQPRIGLNASVAHAQASPGNLAFITQSGALATAMLDWARSAHIGFSCLVSLGNCADVDFGDLLDYLCHDHHTRAILLYIESIGGARKFMSAARAAARNKPVIVVKAGRHAEGATVAASYAAVLAGVDDVYDAAFRRAGMLRVNTTRELFDAAQTLARLKPLAGERLAIVSNGGGPAVMATDELIAGGGELAALSSETLAALDLPEKGAHGNLVDIGGDAPAHTYVQALEAVLQDPSVDAALLLHAPTAFVPAADIAKVCADAIVASGRPTLTCWMGGESVRESRDVFTQRGIPTYSTPEEAVGAFIHAVRYSRNQRQLMEVPSSIPESFVPQTGEVKTIVAAALAQRRPILTEAEARRVLAAYCIPVAPPVAASTDEAARTGAVQPTARLAHELIAGIALDPTFGPVILFGQGGAQAEAAPDRAIGFPPLNTVLAAELISRTKVSRLLSGFRNSPAIDMRALELALVQLSQLAVDVAEIVALDIDRLLADDKGVVALNVRIRVAPARGAAADRLAIRPYPKELEEHIVFEGRTVLLRPLRPEDAPQHREFISHISEHDMHSRFFRAVKELPPGDLAYLTQLDYERAMAFIAVGTGSQGQSETLGVVRAQADPDNESAEFAVLIRSDLKGQGLGSQLMEKIIRYCRQRGVRRIAGDVLVTNERMLQLAASQGFTAEPAREGVVRVSLELNPQAS
jgi:acetyltransferase